ncbi:hypothetical protein OEZ86_010409 [Tetradesmus obliquus]|nr:hypothetical protein OEZ86_010409 [Tetradesmus obliquus]
MLSNWHMYDGVPSSTYRRAQLLSTARMSHCNKNHKTAAACYKDQANRCYWVRPRDGPQQCQSADYYELLLWTEHNFTADVFTLPAAMTCPGSKAAEFFSCFSRPDVKDGCQQLPGCYKAEIQGGTVCFPKWVQKATTQQFDAFYDSLVAMDPKVYGSCAAACWLRQAEACLKRTASGEAGCQAAPYCFWNPANKICLRNTLEFDGLYDKQVQRLYMMCYETETPQECTAHVIPTKHSQAVASWTKLAQASGTVQCKL